MDSRVRILALGGVAGPVLFATLIVVCGALRPDYRHVQHFISELGATGTPNAALMNLAGFVPAGLLLAAFGASLALGFARSGAVLGAAACIAVFGLGHVAAGLYSCDPGCPLEGATWQATVHDRVSLTAFVAGVAGIALWARVFRRLPAWRPLAGYSAVSSLIAFGLLVGLGLSMEARAFTGAWQRLFIGTLYLWCAVVGVRMSRFASPRR
jgi:hypothetical membrane protein